MLWMSSLYMWSIMVLEERGAHKQNRQAHANFFLRTLKIALTLHLRSLVHTTSFTVPPRAIVIGIWKVGKYRRRKKCPHYPLDRNQVLKVIFKSRNPSRPAWILTSATSRAFRAFLNYIFCKKCNTTTKFKKKNIEFENLDIHSL